MDGAVTDKATEVVTRWFDEVWNKGHRKAPEPEGRLHYDHMRR